MLAKTVFLNIKTIEGDSIGLSKEEVIQIPLIGDIIQYTSTDNLNIEMSFSTETINNYFEWLKNNEIVNEMEWINLVDLFIFADFVGCENYLRYFVLNIVVNILLEEDVLTIRFLLSMTHDHAYLKATYDDNDHSYDPLESFSNNDYLLSYVKLEDLLSLFRTLPMYSQHKLIQTFPKSHSVRQHLFNEILLCTENIYEEEEEE